MQTLSLTCVAFALSIAVATESRAGEDDVLEVSLAAFRSAQFERTIVLTEAALNRTGLELAERVELLSLGASAKVVVGDFLGGEKGFREALRLDPTYSVSDDLSPKIVAVFRKVQAEERELREKLDAVRFERAARSLELLDPLPTEGQGGRSLPIRVRVKDPFAEVARVEFFFRGADSESAFSIRPLDRDPLGVWVTELPPEMTSNQNGLILESFLRVSNGDDRVLRDFHSEDRPHRVVLKAGDTSPPFYRRTWFWAVTGASLAALGGLSAYFIHDARQPEPSEAGVWTIR